ncbi:MAG TPA: Nramp family divalent metal transporter [Pyrinomonadaceae bacterium]|nr:Nramp family divalent metal transporter [Pyrinomonadaceae bacterium]HQX54729.1 Nramp family divalent metal transporter [Pyrinomonadaceae bacterium]HQY68061.1 Nramp family divalent metal transporter [Pyrinomonadaceae bacterium]HRA41918.1 Nramp family divalent metal transporter [Pyrinomonadaceae bacterium]
MRSIQRLPQRLRRGLSEYRFFAYLAILGPGIISANAGNDASGIATYSSVGAAYGYELLWAFIPMTISLIIVQEMCVRMGVVTGQGLADLIREQFGVRWTAFVMFALLIANTGVIISEFVGIAQASELFGIPRYITIPLTAISIWWLVVRGTQKRVERVFLLMSLVFLCYIASAYLAKPDWASVGKHLIEPQIRTDTGYLFMVMALIGTTITPFMQVYVQSSVVEKQMNVEDLPMVRADVVAGTIFACMIAAFIVICTGATLHSVGITSIDSAATAAESFAPIAGQYAKYLFAIGLFGAAMLAMGVLPLATAYSLSEAMGFEKGLSRSFREAPIFLGIFTALILVGAIVAMIPGIPQIRLLILTQSVNGLLLPIILVAIVLLSNNREIMGEYRNRFIHNVFAVVTTLVVSILSLLLIGKTIADMF